MAIGKMQGTLSESPGGTARAEHAEGRTARAVTGERTVAPTARELAGRYGDAVHAYACRRVGNPDGAEDVAAETFAAAFQQIRQCPAPAREGEDHDPARAWLFGIARRKVADYLRGRERRREVALDTVPEAGDGDAGPESLLLRGEAAEKVRETLDVLPDDYREALLLKYAEGCSVAEIATVLGRTVPATDSLLQRARAAAREHSGGYFAGETGKRVASGRENAERRDRR